MTILDPVRRLLASWERLPLAARVTVLSGLVFGIWLLLVGHILDNTPVFGYVRGGTADWLVAREAWLGGDPYAALDQIAERRLGWLNIEPPHAHPRPPSALFLLGPLALSPPGSIILVLAVVSAVCMAFWTTASVRWAGFSPRAEFLIVPLAVAAPSLHSVVWGSHIPIVAAFLGLALHRGGDTAYRAGGIAFASGYKLFPFLLAFAVNRGRWRMVMLAGSVFLGITIAGLLLPGVDLGEAVSALTNAPETYGTSDVNLTLNGLLGWSPGAVVFPLLGVVGILVASRYLSSEGMTALALIAMVVMAPYAWPEYMILWLPALLYLWRLGTPQRVTVLLFVMTVGLTRDGRLLLTAGLILAAALVLAELTIRRRDRSAAASQLAV